MALNKIAGEPRLDSQRLASATNTLSEGSCGQLYCQPANIYSSALPFPPLRFKQDRSIPSRSTYRHHLIRTLSNNRRTLSLTPRARCLLNCFTLAINFRNQEDYGLVGRQTYLEGGRLCPEPALKPGIKIKCGRSPQLIISNSGYLPPFKNHETFKKNMSK